MSSVSPQYDESQRARSYRFGPFLLDTKQAVVFRNGELIKIAPKTFQLLRLLVEHNRQIVDKATIMQELWPDTFVEDANLTVHVSALRKTLNGDLDGDVTIETFPKIGYRFQADVSVIYPESEHSPALADSYSQLETGGSRRRGVFAFWPVLAVIALASIAAAVWLAPGRPAPTPQMIRVSGTESSSSIALSPDGQYIAHAVSKFGKRALTMTNIGSGSSVQLTAPEDSLYWGMKFSRDNSYLYFVRSQNSELILEKIPILGGHATTIMRGFPEGFAISPDSSKISYVRAESDGSSVMYTANVDGTGEKEIARRTKPAKYSNLEIAWSPDGKRIANLANNTENGGTLISVDVDTGSETILSNKSWAGGDGIAWLPDGSGIVGGLFETGNAATQVWLVPINGGEPRKITTDLENYGAVDISADGKTILAGQFKDQSSLWIRPAGRTLESRPVNDEKHHMFRWVRWKGEQELVFASSIGPNRDVWTMDAQGLRQKQITENAKANIMADASRDGATIYFSSNRAGKGVYNIYHCNSDGQEVSQLTFGDGEFQPEVSPDGKWLYYTAGNPNGDELKRTIWKVASTGGEPVQLTATPSFYPAVSPDGQYIAFWQKQPNVDVWRVAIMKTSGEVVKLLDIPRSNPIAWTPDGKGISFIRAENGVSNIWTQPIDGDQAVQETRFASDQVVNFDWSAGGQLVCSRNSRHRDVFLIRNFR